MLISKKYKKGFETIEAKVAKGMAMARTNRPYYIDDETKDQFSGMISCQI